MKRSEHDIPLRDIKHFKSNKVAIRSDKIASTKTSSSSTNYMTRDILRSNASVILSQTCEEYTFSLGLYANFPALCAIVIEKKTTCILMYQFEYADTYKNNNA